MKHDPSATETFAETHVRRLEAMRRLTGGAERSPDGSWTIAPDHLERVAAYEAARLRDRPVAVTILSFEQLDRLVDADAATWLDRELVAPAPELLRDAGFGHEAHDAHHARQRHQLVDRTRARRAVDFVNWVWRMLWPDESLVCPKYGCSGHEQRPRSQGTDILTAAVGPKCGIVRFRSGSDARMFT
ncbi:MAG: DUF3363 domain-containing protein [Sphingomicrobium sp.]